MAKVIEVMRAGGTLAGDGADWRARIDLSYLPAAPGA
jgi:hypothetical protein